MAERFAEIASEQGAIWLQRSGDEEVIPAGLAVSLANAAETAAKPCVSKGAVDGNCLIELSDGFSELASGGEQKSFRGPSLGVAMA